LGGCYVSHRCRRTITPPRIESPEHPSPLLRAVSLKPTQSVAFKVCTANRARNHCQITNLEHIQDLNSAPKRAASSQRQQSCHLERREIMRLTCMHRGGYVPLRSSNGKFQLTIFPLWDGGVRLAIAAVFMNICHGRVIIEIHAYSWCGLLDALAA
jgi:hypothetical protein